MIFLNIPHIYNKIYSGYAKRKPGEKPGSKLSAM